MTFTATLVLIAIVIGVALACRDILCWIFKVEDRIKNLNSITAQLSSIDSKLEKIVERMEQKEKQDEHGNP